MRNSLRYGFIAAALAAAFGAFSAAETSAQAGGVNEILKAMDDHHRALVSLQADAVMAKYNAQLDETDVTEGSVKYLPKTRARVMYIRVDWTKPVVEQISVIGDAYTLYRPRLKQVYVGKTEKAKNNANVGNALSFMSMSKSDLTKNYTVKILGNEKVRSGDLTKRLELTPKKASGYKLAYLWVDGNGMPVQAQIVENNNDSTTVLLSNLKKNETLNGPDFDIQYPKSIKPIRG